MRLRLRTDELVEKAASKGDKDRKAIAVRIGVKPSTVCRLFSGESTPTLDTLMRLHDAYGVPLLMLVQRGESEQVPA
ncbi:helix-turn-helix domain-containing protein [Streptomyces sp. NBC_01207]|uniref:helix-turn-helix domain-containing protein n=1 Tax=Streptomyces sp. NBC_01207 TaxID=2903772 RepID=UPI002E166782|nr:helix-turn-helix domain-containing protein [Streptomyces sp. NBC_01207]